MISLSGKVIAITGAASGIGRCTALLLASLGAKLSIADLQQDALDAVATVIQGAGHGDVFSKVVDVRNASTVDTWIQETVQWAGRLDGAANLAGVIGKSIGLKGASIKDIDNDEWDFIMDVNLKGLMHCLRAELQVMADNGSIVNAASIAGLQGFGRNAAYSASKHGVIGLSRSAAKEAGEQNIRVNCIAPGAIQTPMLAKSNEINGNINVKSASIALPRQGTPEEAANLIAFLLCDASSFITGAVYSIDGGWAC
ncbi:hypothetical protein BJX61DRAFT_543374 [Aspergillus egyptiacus]|nr:hypothetical protein BJX61DRAFT_543374 [Aspergillus egyptiacus]